MKTLNSAAVVIMLLVAYVKMLANLIKEKVKEVPVEKILEVATCLVCGYLAIASIMGLAASTSVVASIYYAVVSLFCVDMLRSIRRGDSDLFA